MIRMAGHLVSCHFCGLEDFFKPDIWILHVFIVSARNSLCKSVLLVN